MATNPKLTATKWPADKIERRALEILIPDARNARKHSPEQIAQIAASMREWGWTNPVLVDEGDRIIAGHGRVLAAGRLGFAEVPVMVAEGWTEAQKRAYIIADNQLALTAEWDMELLASEARGLAEWSFDLSLLGFSDLDDLLARSGDAGLTDPDEVPPLPEEPVTQPGDLWLLGRHRLLCGDSTVATNVERVLGGVEPHLMVTSPPYNQKIDGFKPSGMHKEHGWVRKVGKLAYADDLPERDYQGQQRDLLALWFTFMRDGASIFYNHKNRYRDKAVISPLEWLAGPFTLRQEIIWRRPGSVTQNARMFLPCDERIFWLYKGDDFTFNDTTKIKTWSSVWDIAPKPNLDHPVAFPVELPERCILACSNAGDLIFEPFSGSGTTIIAAEMTGRSCHAIEISPAYVDVAVQRWQAFTGQIATLEGNGRGFRELADEREAMAP
jgi:DNA modification methylase